MIDLAGATVIVTGAGGGIGAAVCRAILRAGGQVVAQHRTRPLPPALASAPALIDVQLELHHADAPDRLLEAAPSAVRGLVHAAADQALGSDPDDDELLDRLLRTNTVLAKRLTDAAAAHMVDGGSVVHLSSVEARRPGSGHGAYATSKAALEGVVRASARRHGSGGVRVNAVAPGLVDRDGLAEDWPEGVEAWRDAAALGRLVSSADVAGACLFLLSDLAAGVTGTILTVDGGVTSGPVA